MLSLRNSQNVFILKYEKLFLDYPFYPFLSQALFLFIALVIILFPGFSLGF